jgi:hypothetical protein
VDRLRELPPWFWALAVAVVALAGLAYNRFVIDNPQGSYLDADQPPLNVDATPVRVPRARVRTYPATLRAWPDSMVGDC